MPSKFLNISNDNTLGGSAPSPEIIPSEKAISEYINQRVINATELVANLIADTDFQDWCDAQTPPIPYSGSSMTWSEDFVTVLSIYSRFIQDYGNSVTYWGTHIINDIDVSKKSGVICSVDIATQNRLGVVKGSAAYSPSDTYGQVVVAPDGSLYANVSNITVSHDFTFQTIGASASTSVIFYPNQRNTIRITSTFNIGFDIFCNNSADNYIWVQNSGSSDIDIFINNVYYYGSSQTNIYLPSNGITIPSGKVGEIGVVSNPSGTYITCTYIEL